MNVTKMYADFTPPCRYVEEFIHKQIAGGCTMQHRQQHLQDAHNINLL
jgi:hypothetical protein